MTDAAEKTLPDWAEHQGESQAGRPIIAVDATPMYEALLGELEAFYADEANVPGDWTKADGDLRKEWADALDGLQVDEPTRYWAEVAYQMMKLELQLAVGSMRLEIRVHDDEKKYAQANLEPGRPMNKVPGGVEEAEADLPGRATTTEAREHFKRLRGFLPA